MVEHVLLAGVDVLIEGSGRIERHVKSGVLIVFAGYSQGFCCCLGLEGGRGGALNSVWPSHILSSAHLRAGMALSWLALGLSAVIILRLSSVSLPTELGGFASFPLEELEYDGDDDDDDDDVMMMMMMMVMMLMTVMMMTVIDDDDDDADDDDDDDNDNDDGRHDEHGQGYNDADVDEQAMMMLMMLLMILLIVRMQ